MRAFTLLELLVVLIIVGIMAGIAIPNYVKTSERAKDREAQTSLSLIQAAERMYRLRNTAYYSSTSITAINDNLHLSLASQSWNYTIPSASVTDFNATAVRSSGPARTCWINSTNANATCP